MSRARTNAAAAAIAEALAPLLDRDVEVVVKERLRCRSACAKPSGCRAKLFIIAQRRCAGLDARGLAVTDFFTPPGIPNRTSMLAWRLW